MICTEALLTPNITNGASGSHRLVGFRTSIQGSTGLNCALGLDNSHHFWSSVLISAVNPNNCYNSPQIRFQLLKNAWRHVKLIMGSQIYIKMQAFRLNLQSVVRQPAVLDKLSRPALIRSINFDVWGLALVYARLPSENQ